MSDEFLIKRFEMGITHADFLRVFRMLVAPEEVTMSGLTLATVWTPDRCLTVVLSAQRLRTIAGLSLPSLDARLQFSSWPEGAVESFMKRFDRAFQQGGG